jgi:hypothetical protein
MLFASFDFLIFFVPVLLAFWALRNHPAARVLMLLVASYFFYMGGSRPPPGEVSPPWYFAGLLVAWRVRPARWRDGRRCGRRCRRRGPGHLSLPQSLSLSIIISAPLPA